MYASWRMCLLEHSTNILQRGQLIARKITLDRGYRPYTRDMTLKKGGR